MVGILPQEVVSLDQKYCENTPLKFNALAVLAVQKFIYRD